MGWTQKIGQHLSAERFLLCQPIVCFNMYFIKNITGAHSWDEVDKISSIACTVNAASFASHRCQEIS